MKDSNLSKEKQEALHNVLSKIEKQYGEGSVMVLGDDVKLDIDSIPTGSLALDIALGIGGIPKGRIIEIYGPESSGKTTLALHMLAEAQKMGGTGAFVDAEHALDPGYAKNLGVDIENLIISQPDTGEQALEITEALVRSNAVDLIIIDSVAALVPKAEIDGEMGAAQIGLQARLMSQALRKLTGAINKSKCTVVFINQLRETTTGGRALKFYSSVRLDIRRTEIIKKGDEMIGNRVRVKVVKNKIAPPFKQAEFDIMYGKGISSVGNILDVASEADIVKKAGAWYSYGEERLGQGRENAKEFLEGNPELLKEIEHKVRLHYNLIPEDEVEAENTDAKSENFLEDK